MAKSYKIYPSIGFARVGTSPETFLAPETPGTYARPDDGKYRDAAGKLKRQAARFWVFEYDDSDPSASPEPVQVGGDVVHIEWSVHLANKKAIWFRFAGLIGEGPAGYPAGHPLRNASVADPAQRQKTLIIDPGPRTLLADGAVKTHEISKGTGPVPAAEHWPPAFTGGAAITSLGTMRTDAEGRLTVAGGYGTSGTPGPLPPTGFLNYDNNDNWFDDTSDGPVTAKLVFSDGTIREVEGPAWVIVGPPDYAPPIEHLVTTYDLLYDLGLREFGTDPVIYDPVAKTFVPTFQPSFKRHVLPILRRALDYRWVIDEAAAHANNPKFDLAVLAAPPAPSETPATNPRDKIFRRMRDPDNVGAAGSRNMPRLHNDGTGGVPPETRRFTVTRFQFFVLKQWAAGKFLTGSADPAPTPAGLTPESLNRAAFDAACGGSFFPGMESGWILRDPRIYLNPFDFRFRHLTAEGPNGFTPGDATKRMALPWQADFLKCGNYWWPAQRPNQVLVGGSTLEWDRAVSSHVHLVSAWSQLGVVAPDPTDPNRYVETERTLPEPP